MNINQTKCVMRPIWTPDDGLSGPSEAQRRAMAGLRCLLRMARGGRGAARASRRHPGKIPALRMD